MSTKLPVRFQGESAESFLDRLMPALDEAFSAQAPGGLSTTIYDNQGRPMLSPLGVFAYAADGTVPVSPDIVQINTQDIVDAAIATSKLGDGAVSSAKIQDAAITSAKIGTAAVVTAAIGDLQVTTAKMADLSVNNAKLANAAVGSANIQNAAITNALIANAAVGTAQIQGAAITSALIANLAVGTAHIQDLSVDTIKIANGAVTNQNDAPGASVTCNVSGSTTLCNCSVTSVGKTVGIIVATTISLQSGAGGSSYPILVIKRDGTIIFEAFTSLVVPASATLASGVSATFFDQPGAGTHNYELDVIFSTNASVASAGAGGIYVFELMK
jgi:hypothetical protein